MGSSSDTRTISSKEILARTGISRATLNNYISLHLIPPPTVRKPDEPGGPTKIGYFPVWVVDRILKIQELKSSGMRMGEIADYFKRQVAEESAVQLDTLVEAIYPTMEQIVFPAILVNERWEIVWINEKAERELFKKRIRRIPSAPKRNLFRLFLEDGLEKRFSNWQEAVIAHLKIAKRELKEDFTEAVFRDSERDYSGTLKRLWHQAESIQERPITQQSLPLRTHTGKILHRTLFSSDFREGTLLLYTPASMQLEQILNLLMGREKLIKSVLAQRIPSLTDLCLLAARIESTLHLRTALPASEYFDLINQLTLMCHHCVQRHGGTPGRSIHEGIVAFFPSIPESPRQYLTQALECACELVRLTTTIDKQWKYQKAWSNTIFMNIGVHCGREWLGTVPSSLAFEFTVMGESLLETVKLCSLARGGTVWASKKVIEDMDAEERRRVKFGIRRPRDGESFLSPGIYARIKELHAMDELERRGLREIQNLAVTEVFHLESVGQRD
ncbi:MAG: hypothetical protein JRJ12_12530 [Deltaproteobacteria bacterium]|nr:hypothetical protein [Deltaproteobacteria bacterium]MBW2071792.1 hypothetical protein [Deltaproteobacteria bacterium]